MALAITALASREQAAPVVNVHPAQITVEAPPPAQVTIAEGAIQFHSAPPAPPPDQQRMEYDEAGRLVGLVNLHVVAEEETA